MTDNKEFIFAEVWTLHCPLGSKLTMVLLLKGFQYLAHVAGGEGGGGCPLVNACLDILDLLAPFPAL